MKHSKPVRVLYCESNMDGTIGGSHYCLLHLAAGLDRAEFEPIAVFYQDHALIANFRNADITTHIFPRRAGVRFAGLTAGRGLASDAVRTVARSLARAINVLRFCLTVVKYAWFLRRQQIGIVHLNNSILRHHDWMMAALLTRTVCLTHERGINREYSSLSKFLSRRLARVICVSKAIRDLMVERGVPSQNICVMYDGLDPSRLKPVRSPETVRAAFGIGADQPVVGIIGNIREWKGQEVVVRAMSLIVRRHPAAVCLFVGDTADRDLPYLARLEHLVEELELASNIKFTGYQRNVADFLNVFDISIHASIEPEPFGMVVLEAMAMRKPVVGSRGGGVPEMIVEGVTGYTFEPGNWQQLAACVVEILDDRKKMHQMGENGLQRVIRDFDLRSYVKEVEDFYKEIAGGHTPAPTRTPLTGEAGR